MNDSIAAGVHDALLAAGAHNLFLSARAVRWCALEVVDVGQGVMVAVDVVTTEGKKERFAVVLAYGPFAGTAAVLDKLVEASVMVPLRVFRNAIVRAVPVDTWRKGPEYVG